MWLAVDFTYSSDSQGTPQPEAGVSPCQRNSAHTDHKTNSYLGFLFTFPACG